MKIKLLFGIFCLISVFTYSQNTIPVEIIMKNKDTLFGKMKVKVNLFDKKLIYPSSFNSKVKFYNKIGKKRKIKSKEITELKFIDFKNKTRKFVKIKEFKHHLVEEVYIGKIKWYKHYSYDLYNQTENVYEEIFDENNKQFSIGLFSSYKKKMRKITKGNSKLEKFIKENDMKKDENILKALKMYELEL